MNTSPRRAAYLLFTGASDDPRATNSAGRAFVALVSGGSVRGQLRHPGDGFHGGVET